MLEWKWTHAPSGQSILVSLNAPAETNYRCEIRNLDGSIIDGEFELTKPLGFMLSEMMSLIAHGLVDNPPPNPAKAEVLPGVTQEMWDSTNALLQQANKERLDWAKSYGHACQRIIRLNNRLIAALAALRRIAEAETPPITGVEAGQPPLFRRHSDYLATIATRVLDVEVAMTEEEREITMKEELDTGE